MCYLIFFLLFFPQYKINSNVGELPQQATPWCNATSARLDKGGKIVEVELQEF